MKLVRNSLLVASGTLPFSFLLLTTPPVLAAPPLSQVESETTLLDLTLDDTTQKGTEDIHPSAVAVTIRTLTAVPFKSTPAADVTQATPQDPSSLSSIESRKTAKTASPKKDTTKPAANPQTSTSQAKPTSTSDKVAEPTKPSAEITAEPAKPATREQKLAAADRLYLQGQKAEAEALYRQVKDPFAKTEANKLAAPILDPAQLPPGGQVFWREAQGGFTQEAEPRIMASLNLLVEQHPEFIPGHLRLAEAHRAFGHEKSTLAVLEKAAVQYPAQPELLKATIAAQADDKQWLEASIAARQFVLLNPNHPEAPAFTRLADENQQQFKSKLRGRLRRNTITSALAGVLGAFLGNPLAPLSSVQTTALLLRGETAVGNSITKRAKKQLKLVEDPEIQDYVNQLGQKLAATTGRSEFKYEFYVVRDDKLNAFALPGGKVFVNAGAIAKTNSEAELAGLLAHELAHAALSHGFKLATEGSAIAGIARMIPFGGTLTNLAVLDYSRDMERQADILGTRVLASAGYAADGMRNLMVTMDKEDKEIPFIWLSSHPVTDKRILYLEALIERNGYNRYAYEGVERHAAIKAKVEKLLAELKEHRDKKK